MQQKRFELLHTSHCDYQVSLFQEGNLDSKKVEMLISCLETGKDIWTDLERNLLQSARS